MNTLSEILRVLKMEGAAIQACAGRLENNPEAAERIQKAVETFNQALTRGGKIIVTGVGKSGKVAQKIAATLCSTGSLAVFLHPTEGLHGDIGLITEKDAILALSYTGNTEELLRLLPSLKKLRVPVVAVCGSQSSKLAAEADVWIDSWVDQEACPHNLAPTSSTTLALALGDALAMALMQLRGFDAQKFAAFHPGGSLGNRLTLTVADVMHKGEAVGTVPASASMKEVVTVLTRTKMGGILVTEGRKLLGFITDGDVRRALQHQEGFFAFKAADIMTHKPITVSRDAMAKVALDLMENRPSQIYVLPVVDNLGQWEGILRMHDLAKLF